MSFEQLGKVINDPKYGIILKLRERDVAERFEEFLTEECFVHFIVRTEPDEIWFLFGQVGSERKVRELYQQFAMMTVAH